MLKTLELNKQDYLYFGNGNYAEILSQFLKTNPFFASALTLIPGADDFKFELRTFRASAEPTPDESWYTPIMESSLRDPETGRYRTATDEYNREVNALFTSDFKLISITCKDGTVIESFSESQLNLYCSGLLYNLFFYSSAVHAAMHVLHYLMGAGIDSATAHHDVMDKWASPYFANLTVKYQEVAKLLIADSDLALINGKHGLGGSGNTDPTNIEGTVAVLVDLMTTWGQCDTLESFLKKFLLKGVYATVVDRDDEDYVLNNSGLLNEFMKHAKLVPDYADQIDAHFEVHDRNAKRSADRNIARFMEEAGFQDTAILSIKPWISLMSLTGLVHGGTLSYTRLLAMPEILRWRKPISSGYNHYDLNLLSVGLGTMVGMDEGRHVFSDSIQGHLGDSILMDILSHFDDETARIKKEFKKKIKRSATYRDYGWILSDYCPDGTDGKQLTLCTYI
ncbi:unnamed protein product [Ectocarpus fasciculatus]